MEVTDTSETVAGVEILGAVNSFGITAGTGCGTSSTIAAAGFETGTWTFLSKEQGLNKRRAASMMIYYLRLRSVELFPRN
jgi:hypothetical protein